MKLKALGINLKQARKKCYPKDDQAAFAIRIGVSIGTYARMEQGDLSIGIGKYYAAARLLRLDAGFDQLFAMQQDLLDG